MRNGYTTLKAIGFEQIAVDAASALAAIPKGAQFFSVQAEAQAVRMRLDSTNPTATVGQRLLVTEGPLLIPCAPHSARFIAEVAGGKVNVHYFGE